MNPTGGTVAGRGIGRPDPNDCLLERLKFARYADDLVILARSPRAGRRVMESIRRFLEVKLKLKVNEQKSSVAATDRITFLGFSFKGGRILYGKREQNYYFLVPMRRM